MGLYKRGNVYWYSFKLKGCKQEQISTEIIDNGTKTVREIALQIGESARNNHKLGKTFKIASNISLQALLNRYIEKYCKKQGSFRTKRSSAKILIDLLGSSTKAAEITWNDVLGFCETRHNQGIKRNTIARDLNTLSDCYEVAMKDDEVRMLHNPVADVPRNLKKINFGNLAEFKRDRTATDAEIRAFWSRFTPLMKHVFVFSIRTGMRAGEIRKVKKTDIDLEKRGVYCRKNKEGKPKFVPLHMDAVEVVRKRLALNNKSEWLFCTEDGFQLKRDGIIKSQFQWLKKKLGIKNLRWHDLRRNYGNEFQEATQDIKAYGQIVGHSNTRTTDTYTPVRHTYLLRQVDKVGSIFDKLADNDQENMTNVQQSVPTVVKFSSN